MLCKPEARRLFKMIVVEVKLSEGEEKRNKINWNKTKKYSARVWQT